MPKSGNNPLKAIPKKDRKKEANETNKDGDGKTETPKEVPKAEEKKAEAPKEAPKAEEKKA